jgi:hypothetical protein
MEESRWKMEEKKTTSIVYSFHFAFCILKFAFCINPRSFILVPRSFILDPEGSCFHLPSSICPGGSFSPLSSFIFFSPLAFTPRAKRSAFFPLPPSSKPPIGPAIGAGPGDAVAGHPPGVFLEANLADLKPAGADPAELLPPAAAMALKGAPGLPRLGSNGLIHGIVPSEGAKDAKNMLARDTRKTRERNFSLAVNSNNLAKSQQGSHCEEGSDEAIPRNQIVTGGGLLRSARNDDFLRNHQSWE